MSLKLSIYLKILKKKANTFERTSINGVVDNSLCAKYLLKIIFAIVSLILVSLLKNGLSNNFVSYGSSILSILVGLFITALVFSLDKFYTSKTEENTNSKTKVLNIQAFNYTKQFVYITGYTISLSIFTLILLALSALFEIPSTLNIYDLEFNFKKITFDTFLMFCQAIFFVIQRFLILYWLLRIMYNTLFIVSSMVEFMTTKIEIDETTKSDLNSRNQKDDVSNIDVRDVNDEQI